MKRSELLEVLTANCKCDQDKAAMNSLSNAGLVAIANAMPEVFKKNANRMAGKRDDDDEDKDEELDDLNKNGSKKAEGSNADVTGGGFIQAGGKGTKDEYSTNKAQTLTEWEASMPPEALAVWNTAKSAELRERKALIDHLTANVQNPDKKALLTNKFMTTSVKDLQDLIAIAAPAPVRRVAVPDPIYTGASTPSGITGNRDADDVLDLPRMDLTAAN